MMKNIPCPPNDRKASETTAGNTGNATMKCNSGNLWKPTVANTEPDEKLQTKPVGPNSIVSECQEVVSHSWQHQFEQTIRNDHVARTNSRRKGRKSKLSSLSTNCAYTARRSDPSLHVHLPYSCRSVNALPFDSLIATPAKRGNRIAQDIKAVTKNVRRKTFQSERIRKKIRRKALPLLNQYKTPSRARQQLFRNC